MGQAATKQVSASPLLSSVSTVDHVVCKKNWSSSIYCSSSSWQCPSYRKALEAGYRVSSLQKPVRAAQSHEVSISLQTGASVLLQSRMTLDGRLPGDTSGMISMRGQDHMKSTAVQGHLAAAWTAKCNSDIVSCVKRIWKNIKLLTLSALSRWIARGLQV